MKLYPLKFENIYKDYIWGGRNLAKIGKTLPQTGNVAESWELACHKNGMSVIANGEYKGVALDEYIEKYNRNVIGSKLPQKDIDKFPLLIKFIDANDSLSVQVHPDDQYAYVNENGELGKNEMWYILSAEPNATLVAGVAKGVTKEVFERCVKENKVEECLNYLSVKAGDFINIPSGLIHAIGKGIILAEVQQNSDTTYRVYDYNRVDNQGNARPLHVEKSLETIDFSYTSDVCGNTEGLNVNINKDFQKNIKIANKYFAVEFYDLNNGCAVETADGSRFFIYMICSGEGTIFYDGGQVEVKMGETLLIPAHMGNYRIEGKLTAIKSYVPDLESDIINPLLKAGYTKDEIYKKVEGLNQ